MSDATSESRGARAWLTPILVVVGAIVLITAVLSGAAGGRDGDGAAPAGEAAASATPVGEEPDLTVLETRDPDDVQAIGPVDAPVALVVYSDYQCKFCAQWTHDTLPEMLKYVDAGDLRIEWRDVNVFGEASERAARAARAAALQDQYWEYHDALFTDGKHRSERELTEDKLVELAGDLGLDEDRFREDLASDEVTADVQQMASEGRSVGVSSTPAFILDGQPVLGAQPTEVFVDLMDSALADNGN